MHSIFTTPFRTAGLATAIAIVLIAVSLNVSSVTFAGLFAAWSGSLASFACAIFALVMFVHGLRRGMRRAQPMSKTTAQWIDNSVISRTP